MLWGHHPDRAAPAAWEQPWPWPGTRRKRSPGDAQHAGGGGSSAQQVQQLQRWRGSKSWLPLQRHAGSAGIAGASAARGLLLANPAERQGEFGSVRWPGPLRLPLRSPGRAEGNGHGWSRPCAWQQRGAGEGGENVPAGANSAFTPVTRYLHCEGICLCNYF